MMSWIKSKALSLSVVVLATLLAYKTIESSGRSDELVTLKDAYILETERSDRLSTQVESLQRDLKETPDKVVVVTKEVMTEVCEGKVLAQKINNLPKREEAVNEATDKEPVADLDDALPAELVRLLK